MCRKFVDNDMEELIRISLFYSGPKERKGRYGTGFIINAKMRKSFLSFKPLNDMLCKLRLRGKFTNKTVI